MSTNNNTSKGWHNRGYLPHYDASHIYQFITYRLADSLPQSAITELQNKLGDITDDTERLRQERERVEFYINQGHGDCLLNHSACAQTIIGNWQHFHCQRYQLINAVVMPNHVHVLIQTIDDKPLSRIIDSWKSYTANAINRSLGRTGTVWQADYWDRYIRNAKHYADVNSYINRNPVAAGLCENEDEWQWTLSNWPKP